MSQNKSELWVRVIQVSIVVFLASLALACAPMVNCYVGDDAAAPDAETTEVVAPTFDACLTQYPPTKQRAPLGVAIGAFLFGVVGALRRRVDEQDDAQPDELDQILTQTNRPNRIEDSQMASELRGVGKFNVEAIELSQELDIRSTPEEARQEPRRGHKTLMDMVAIQVETLQEREEQSRVQRVMVEGFYCPRPLAGKPIVYVDPGHESSSDEVGRVEPGSSISPFTTIAAALDYAKHLVKTEHIPVQVRVMPGVYQESLVVPDQVSLLNHRIPGDGGLEEHLKWLRIMTDVDHPERVTLLPPPNVDVGILFEPGQKQGLYGFYVVGREGTKQVGIGNERSTKLMIRTCHVMGFKMGGLQLNGCGGELPGSEVRVEGCLFTENESAKGGAIAMRSSLLSVHASIFESNQAQSGGAIYAFETNGTLNITSCRFAKNRAKASPVIKIHPEDIPLASWYDFKGLGGAVALEEGYMKMALCSIVGNGASTAGGAIALLSSRAIFQGEEDRPFLIKQNRARTGGGIFAIGLAGERTTIKASHVNVEENLAQSLGGGFAMIASAVAQFQNSQFVSNSCKGDNSLGGGVGCIYGADFMGSRLAFRRNVVSTMGGAIGVRNASVQLKGHTLLQDNISEAGRAGGIYVETSAGQHLDELIEHGEVETPLMCKLMNLEAVGNLAQMQPSALFVGNLQKQKTLPIEIELGQPLEFRGNNVKGKPGGEMVAIFWCGQPKMTHKGLKPGKYLLH